MSETEESSSLPKSMRHKQILDAAADEPDASISDLARAVPSATPDLVERVLEEHGDPAADSSTPTDDGTQSAESPTDDGTQSAESPTDDGTQSAESPTDDGTQSAKSPTDNGTQSAESPTDDPTEAATSSDELPAADADPASAESTDGGVSASETATPDNADDVSSPTAADAATGATATAAPVDPASLTPAERETLQAIRRNPEATQRALAEELGVSAATVSQRVSGIEGFEWSERAAFVTELPGTPMSPSDATADTTEESIAESLAALEAQVAALAEQQDDQTPFDDPELAAKIVHACMDAETISEDEELEILRTMLA